MEDAFKGLNRHVSVALVIRADLTRHKLLQISHSQIQLGLGELGIQGRSFPEKLGGTLVVGFTVSPHTLIEIVPRSQIIATENAQRQEAAENEKQFLVPHVVPTSR